MKAVEVEVPDITGTEALLALDVAVVVDSTWREGSVSIGDVCMVLTSDEVLGGAATSGKEVRKVLRPDIPSLRIREQEAAGVDAEGALR